ncbi:phosphatidylglycerophosphatase A family protein [Texcoconibacillus texcoconensis]|uniref:Phosphatidylglycerophosphatase A n=1 Tax=Texcoconibacillus texcoconensis TaxID=1095777 RepID=A0A840QLM1_9BACI|nr:phosphatidylglycerophosphatase A [Texcoconibacillus texcoconensis]MBB5172269.1 phosphatidylglycerophosphatase A [Texcoconibacillus texcoconensis]
MTKRQPVHCHEVEKKTRELLEERGVTIEDIAEIVYQLQSPYNDALTLEECTHSVDAVLTKREIHHAVLVGVELDKLAEKKQLSEPLQSIVEMDEGLFGVDETIAFGSVFGYGSIAVTSFGYLDKEKTGIIKELDTKEGETVNTFLDDLICSIAANASSRLAHRLRDQQESLREEEIRRRDEEQRIG